MLALASCVLLATSALATGYAPYTGIQAIRNPTNYAGSGGVYPIDFNEDLIIQNPMVKPGSNIMYSFEQIRRDQPPQVEMREEDVGRYMYRKPSRTTNMRTPDMRPVVQDFSVQIPDSSKLNRNDRYQEVDNWRQMPVSPVMTTTTTQIPFLGQFDEFSFAMPSSDQIKPEARYPPVNTWTSRTTSPSPPLPFPKWEEFSQDNRRKSSAGHRTSERNNYQSQSMAIQKPVQWPVETLSKMAVEEVAPSPQPHWTEIAARQSRSQAAQRTQTQILRNAASRGNHKFNWGELESPVSTPAPAPIRLPPTVAPGSQRKGPPPPVPTLTPWSGDNF